MKKSKILSILSVLIFTLFLIPSLSAEAKSMNNLPIEVMMVENLDEIGEKLNQKDLHINLDGAIKNLKVIENNLNFDLDFKNNSLEIVGELFYSRNTTDILIGDLKDISNNFEIVYFALDRQKNKMNSVYFNLPRKDVTVLQLFLLEKSTNNFYYIEQELDESFNYLFDYNNNYKKASFGMENWYSKILKPIDFVISDPSKEITPLDISPFSYIKTTDASRIYTAYFTVLGETVTEQMIVDHQIVHDTQLSGSSYVNTTLKIRSNQSYSNVPGFNGNGSSLKIGNYNTPFTQIYTSPYEIISTIFASTHGISGGSNIQTYFNLGLPIAGPLSFNISYSDQTSGTKTTLTYNNTNINGNIRSFKTNFPHILNTSGQQLQTNYLIGQQIGGSTGNKTLNVRFVYEVSTDNNYGYGVNANVQLTSTYTR